MNDEQWQLVVGVNDLQVIGEDARPVSLAGVPFVFPARYSFSHGEVRRAEFTPEDLRRGRLLAASPQLLRACQEALRTLAPASLYCYQELVRTLRSAIRLAG